MPVQPHVCVYRRVLDGFVQRYVSSKSNNHMASAFCQQFKLSRLQYSNLAPTAVQRFKFNLKISSCLARGRLRVCPFGTVRFGAFARAGSTIRCHPTPGLMGWSRAVRRKRPHFQIFETIKILCRTWSDRLQNVCTFDLMVFYKLI